MSRRTHLSLLSLALGLLVLGTLAPGASLWLASSHTMRGASAASSTQRAVIQSQYGQLPLSFELNQGQAAAPARFLAHGNGYSLALTPAEALLALQSPPASSAQPSRFRLPGQPALPARTSQQQPPSVVGMQWLGATPDPVVTGEDQLPGTVNYFIGNDPAQWHTNIPTYQQVRLHDVYPGVDLVYYGTHGQLEYDFVVAPSADPSRIALGFTGAQAVGVDLQGNLRLTLPGGTLQQDKPLIYQTINGTRRPIAGGYTLTANQRAGFALSGYDRRAPLVIDPVYHYSTYLGGTGDEQGLGVAVDSAGNAYVTGDTSSTDFPTASPMQASNGGSGYTDAFVSKLNAAGSALVYSTYLGGSNYDSGQSIAVDSNGNAYITGYTFSSNFPVASALQATLHGDGSTSGDAFVSKLNAAGSALVYSTYLGGSNDDQGNGIATDSAGNAYVVGTTVSSDFPTQNAIQPTFGGSGFTSGDAFVSKLNATGSPLTLTLTYSTYLGGSNGDFGTGIAVDANGNAYVTGATDSSNFPTVNPYQSGFVVGGAPENAFVAKVNAAGSALVYSTYLGYGDDGGNAIAVDSSGDAYITGFTSDSQFPTTAGAFQTSCGCDGFSSSTSNAFVTEFNPAGSALVYSTYLGGSGGQDQGYGIAVDSAGNAYVTGFAATSNFPIANAIQHVGGGDAFVSELNASGSALTFSSYLGGWYGDWGYAIAVDSAGDAYVTGQADYLSGYTLFAFPLSHPLQPLYGGGGSDAFVTEIRPQVPTPITTTGVFRPSNGVLYLKNANTTGPADITLYYGKPGDQPITGDWTGKGYKSIGIFRNGTFYLRNSNTTGYADITVPFGNSTDIPVAGDWTGKGYDSIGVYRPSTNTFLLRNSNTAGTPDITARLGISGDVPIVGDWTGKGFDSIGVFRPSNGIVYMRNSNTTGVADINFVYGIAGDKPVVGDWDGDGVDTIGVDRAGRFLLRNSNSTGPANASFYLGVSGDDPIAGPWVAPAGSPPPVRRGPSGSGTHAPARTPTAHQPAGATLPRQRAHGG